ncbi:hypothetical protein VTL71DRAFT_11650 [Oculimacula yallundae]|uniref:Uncharacterized protein n=1 Tax=Oculimacula yallundae TaxID=86028 RepID=A0ABR4CQN8_9HELO
MSNFTKVLHHVIGRAAAEAFVIVGASIVVITSRSLEKAIRVAKEIEAVGKGTTVLGFQYEIRNEASGNALWDDLRRDCIEIDVLVLNASANIPTAQEFDLSISKIWRTFESNVKDQLINVERFQSQGKKQGRHPGFIFTEQNAQHGLTRESLPFDDASLPANFFVWAASKKAAFLHGRFVWAHWDVGELIATKSKLEADKGLLRVGLQGVESQDFELLFAGMNRSI